MLVIMKNDATEEQVEAVINHIVKLGFKGISIPGAHRTAVCIVGNQGSVEDSEVMALEGVQETLRVTKPYKLVSRETHPQPSVITIGNVSIGGAAPVIMAGPCSTRNTLDISAIPCIKEVSHLPVIVDPSHAAGKREYVVPLSKAAIAVGADGLLVEVHHDPPHAASDGRQSLYPEQFKQMMEEIKGLGGIYAAR